MNIPKQSVANYDATYPESLTLPFQIQNSPSGESTPRAAKRMRTEPVDSSSQNLQQVRHASTDRTAPDLKAPAVRQFIESQELRQRLLNFVSPKDYAKVLESQDLEVNDFLMDGDYKHVHKMLQDSQIFQDLVTAIESRKVPLGQQARLIPSMPRGPVRRETLRRIGEELRHRVWLATDASDNPWLTPDCAPARGATDNFKVPQRVIDQKTADSIKMMRVICAGWKAVGVPIDFEEMATVCNHAYPFKQVVNSQSEGQQHGEMSSLEQALSAWLLQGRFHPHTASPDTCLSIAVTASMHEMPGNSSSLSKKKRLNLIEGAMNLYQDNGPNPVSIQFDGTSGRFNDLFDSLLVSPDSPDSLDRDECSALLNSVTRKAIVAYRDFPDIPASVRWNNSPMPVLATAAKKLMLRSGFSQIEAMALARLVLRRPPRIDTNEQVHYVMTTARTLEPILEKLPGDVAASFPCSLLSGLRSQNHANLTAWAPQIRNLLATFLQDQHVSRMSDEDRSTIMLQLASANDQWGIHPYLEVFKPYIGCMDRTQRGEILGNIISCTRRSGMPFSDALPYLEAFKPYISDMPAEQALTILANILHVWRDRSNDEIPSLNKLQPYLDELKTYIPNLDDGDQTIILLDHLLSLVRGDGDASQFQPYVDILKPSITRAPDNAGNRVLLEMSETIAAGSVTDHAELQPYIHRIDNEARGEMLQHLTLALAELHTTFDQIQPYLEAIKPYIADMSAGHSLSILHNISNFIDLSNFDFGELDRRPIKEVQPYFEILKPYFVHEDFQFGCAVIEMYLENLAEGKCEFNHVQPFLDLLLSEEFTRCYSAELNHIFVSMNNVIGTGNVAYELLVPYAEAMNRQLDIPHPT